MATVRGAVRGVEAPTSRRMAQVVGYPRCGRGPCSRPKVVEAVVQVRSSAPTTIRALFLDPKVGFMGHLNINTASGVDSIFAIAAEYRHAIRSCKLAGKCWRGELF
jgi:S-adenosylhomocysteine hydrolase